MKKISLICALTFLIFSCSFATIVFTSTNATQHGCYGSVFAYRMQPIGPGGAFEVFNGITWSITTSINEQLFAGQYFYQCREYTVLSYDVNSNPIWGYDYNNFNVTITQPPCNFGFTLDSVNKNQGPNCSTGKIYYSIQGDENNCLGDPKQYEVKVYKNGIYYGIRNPGNGQDSITNLPSGIYYLKISPIARPVIQLIFPDTACQIISPNYDLNPSCSLKVNLVSVSNIGSTCSNNGSIDISSLGVVSCSGSPSSTIFYLRDSATNSILNLSPTLMSGSTYSFTNLDTGTYYVTIQKNGCQDSTEYVRIHSEANCTGGVTVDSVIHTCSSLSATGKIYISLLKTFSNCHNGWTYYLYKNGSLFQIGNIPSNAAHFTFHLLTSAIYQVHLVENFQSSHSCDYWTSNIQLPLLSATISSSSGLSVCQNSTSTFIFQGIGGFPPYTFTYKINNGFELEVVSNNNGIAIIPVITNVAGIQTYKLVSISDRICTRFLSDSLVFTILPQPNATIVTSDPHVCQYDVSPIVTLNAFDGVSPYYFTYLSEGSSHTAWSNLNGNLELNVPTNHFGSKEYTLISVADNNCFRILNSQKTIEVHKTPIVTAFDVSGCPGYSISLSGFPYGGVYNKPNPYLGPPTDYEYTVTEVTNGFSCSSTASARINHSTCVLIPFCVRKLAIRALIEGFHISAGNINSVLYLTGQTSNQVISDSITLELRDIVFPFNVFKTVSTTIDTNGRIYWNVDTTLGFGEDYYLVIKGRNFLETWSSVPIHLSCIPAYVLFLNSDTVAFGNNQVFINSGLWAIPSGDINQDGSIDSFDYIALDADLIIGNTGYLNSDLNGDGTVDSFDYLILDRNITSGLGSTSP